MGTNRMVCIIGFQRLWLEQRLAISFFKKTETRKMENLNAVNSYRLPSNGPTLSIKRHQTVPHKRRAQ